MQISVILAHPRPGSFNHAIAAEAAAALRDTGHTVTVHDLYQERFDPVLPFGEIARDSILPEEIARHCREIVAADGIIFVHPDWWGMPPAILKGWIDRVLRPGIAYRFAATDSGAGVPEGLLAAQAVLVFNTSNRPRSGSRWSLATARAALEGLHRLALRRTALPAQDVRGDRNQYGEPSQGVA